MSKKNYIAPECEFMECEPLDLLGVSADTQGISYGGVDKEGELEPAARDCDLWEDE